MRDIIVENPMGYVNGCIKNGAKVDDFKLTQDKKILWLENQKWSIRIRGKLPSDA